MIAACHTPFCGSAVAGPSKQHVSTRAAPAIKCAAPSSVPEPQALRRSALKNLLLSAAAVAALSGAPAMATETYSRAILSADIGNLLPRFGSGDPIEQRKQLGEDVGKNDSGSGIYPLEMQGVALTKSNRCNQVGGGSQDATIDNPNDTPRPADRSRQSQPFVPSGEKAARESQLNAARAAAPDDVAVSGESGERN